MRLLGVLAVIVLIFIIVFSPKAVAASHGTVSVTVQIIRPVDKQSFELNNVTHNKYFQASSVTNQSVRVLLFNLYNSASSSYGTGLYHLITARDSFN